jgi:hypothetical protein
MILAVQAAKVVAKPVKVIYSPGQRQLVAGA